MPPPVEPTPMPGRSLPVAVDQFRSFPALSLNAQTAPALPRPTNLSCWPSSPSGFDVTAEHQCTRLAHQVRDGPGRSQATCAPIRSRPVSPDHGAQAFRQAPLMYCPLSPKRVSPVFINDTHLRTFHRQAQPSIVLHGCFLPSGYDNQKYAPQSWSREAATITR